MAKRVFLSFVVEDKDLVTLFAAKPRTRTVTSSSLTTRSRRRTTAPMRTTSGLRSSRGYQRRR
jgi:hypothetical protein